MANQLRDSKGRFLPKDAHIEDVSWDKWSRYYWDNLDTFKPPVRPSKRRKRVILGYVGYVVLCFVMGAVGAYIGAHI